MPALTVIFFLIMLATTVIGEVKIKESGKQPQVQESGKQPEVRETGKNPVKSGRNPLKSGKNPVKSGKIPEEVDKEAEEEDFSGVDDDALAAALADHEGSDDDIDLDDLDDSSGNDGLDDSDLEEEQFASMPLHKIRLLHKAVDADGDNRTSLGELLQFSDNVHNETIKQIVPELLDMLDHIKDGKLSLDEILEDVVDDSSDLSPDEINTWKELETMKFKLADADGDGFLSVDEVDHMFYPETHEGILKLSIEALIHKRDRDGDGKLNFTEFWETARGTDKNAQNHTESQGEHDIFKKLDKDGDGLLDVQELAAWESGKFHTEETLKELLELADVNHDHHLTVEEIEEAKEKIQNIDAGLDLVRWIQHLEL